jgi:hypothetical protein
LATPDSLKSDLAIFGFFVALGRSTRLFLTSKGASEDEAMGGLLRYFEGGGVLFYPELARLPLYQLFVEVVCEEMQWLPFYPGEEQGLGVSDHGHGADALPLASTVGCALHKFHRDSRHVDGWPRRSIFGQQIRGHVGGRQQCDV